MPEPISSNNQTLPYTPAEPEPEEADGGMCVAPQGAPASEPAPQPRVKTSYGDGKIHCEDLSCRVDPSATQTGRVKVFGYDVDLTGTGVDALVGGTTKNADGSSGARLAASANVIQGTATVPNGSGGEVTVGVGIGVGVDVASGTRDADGDGNPEYCARAAFGFGVGGFCSEGIPALIKKAGELLSR